MRRLLHSDSNASAWIGVVSLFAFAGVPLAHAVQQTIAKKAPAKVDDPLAVGATVVLKASDVVLDNNGKLVPTHDQFALVIEKVDGERLLLSSYNSKTKGWVNRVEVLPWDAALDYFSGVIAKNPDNADAHWMRAQFWSARSEVDRSLADLNRAIQLRPAKARFHSLRARIFERKRELDKALADWGRAIELNTTDATVYLRRADEWQRRNDYKRAGADYDEAIRLAPFDAFAWSLRSQCWRHKGEFDNALKDINEAIRLDPKVNFFYTMRGNVWMIKQNYDKAIADFDESIKMNPKDHFAYYDRGRAWREKHDRDKEIADFSQAIKLDPKNVRYLKSRGDAWCARGRHDEAVADYDEVIHLAPTDASAFISRGIEWLKDSIAGRTAPDKAIADFNRAIELDPRSARAYLRRAQAWRLKHDYVKMARDISTAIKVDDLNPHSHAALARLLATCKDAPVRDGKRAVELATLACELSKWQDPDCLDTLATAHAETGDFAAAVKWETQAMKIAEFDFQKVMGMQDRLYLYRHQKPCRE